MFTAIDDKLIECAQWTVRQIELFTKYTRKDVGVVVRQLQLISGAFSIFVALLCVGNFSKDKTLLLVAVPMFLVALLQRNIAIKIKNEKEVFGIQPSSIINEKTFRQTTISMIINFSFSLFLVNFFLGSEKDIPALWTFVNVAKINISILSILLLGLYFLCTSSLPPGEKQKKLLERESKKLTPVPINN